MRIVIDLQGCQTGGSRNRGIGRYSMAFSQALARNARGHEIIIACNSIFPDTIEPISRAFSSLLPKDSLKTWEGLGNTGEILAANRWRRRASQHIRAAALRSLDPDLVHVSSLFEGCGDDAVTDICEEICALGASVTLYDLIPLVHCERYLADPRVDAWYRRKVGQLREAGLCLAISEASRREALQLLELPSEACVNVSAAANPIFAPIAIGRIERDRLRTHFGIARDFVLYTGGIDYRKNIDGLVRAFAKLPGKMRDKYQLAIVCAVTDEQRQAILDVARKAGLAAGDLLLPGYVPEPDLVLLYNTCRLFVFPSLHEGFGLPVLEAMKCGAAVIASDTSSIPEIVGRQDAMFDPRSDTAITGLIHGVLADDARRQSLAAHGLARARAFSWDNCARIALEAFTERFERKRLRQPVSGWKPGGRRPTLALVSPLPPERSGIADYSAQLLPVLAEHFELQLVNDDADVRGRWSTADHAVLSAAEFEATAASYDAILYCFGNSSFHTQMWSLLHRHPGVVVLHDFFLSGLVSVRDLLGEEPGLLSRTLARYHGYRALSERLSTADVQPVARKYPCSAEIIRRSLGVIVHSAHAKALAGEWYGAAAAEKFEIIPFAKQPVPRDKAAARAALDVGEHEFLVCSFGMLGPTKLNHLLIDAWSLSRLAGNATCRLVFVGEMPAPEYEQVLREKMGSLAGVTFTGHMGAEGYLEYLSAADLAVQLRTQSRGETSAAVFDCMAAAVPLIVNSAGAMCELPDGCAMKLPEEFDPRDLAAALETLHANPRARSELAERAKQEVVDAHKPEHVASRYADVVGQFYARGAESSRQRLVRTIARIDDNVLPDDADLDEVACAVVDTFPACPMGSQLLLDITGLVSASFSASEQVRRRQLASELLLMQRPGRRVLPVHAVEGALVHAARAGAEIVGYAPDTLADEPVEAHAGDIYVALFARFAGGRTVAELERMKRRGVRIVLAVPSPAEQTGLEQEDKAGWPCAADLAHLVAQADRAVCLSAQAESAFRQWLDASHPPREEALDVVSLSAPTSEGAAAVSSSATDANSLVEAVTSGAACPDARHFRWHPGQRWSFGGGHARLSTDVGQRLSGKIHTLGKAGWLTYGPYSRVPAGYYRLEVTGTLRTANAAEVEVAINLGKTILARFPIASQRVAGRPDRRAIAEGEFVLEFGAPDLEIRMWVSAATTLSVERIAWTRITAESSTERVVASVAA